jgi:hypothetical protein
MPRHTLFHRGNLHCGCVNTVRVWSCTGQRWQGRAGWACLYWRYVRSTPPFLISSSSPIVFVPPCTTLQPGRAWHQHFGELHNELFIPRADPDFRVLASRWCVQRCMHHSGLPWTRGWAWSWWQPLDAFVGVGGSDVSHATVQLHHDYFQLISMSIISN